jgi:hypothetical protein
LDPSSPSLHRTAIDALHLEKRSQEERTTTLKELNNMVNHLTRQQEALQKALNDLKDVKKPTRFQMGSASLLQLKMLGLSNYASMADVLQKLPPHIVLTLPDVSKIANEIDPFLNDLKYLAEVDENVVYEAEVSEDEGGDDDDDSGYLSSDHCDDRDNHD